MPMYVLSEEIEYDLHCTQLIGRTNGIYKQLIWEVMYSTYVFILYSVATIRMFVKGIEGYNTGVLVHI